jgi:hypothetical protein
MSFRRGFARILADQTGTRSNNQKSKAPPSRKEREKDGAPDPFLDYLLLEITKSTVATLFPPTVTDFSQVLASLNTGRCTLCSVSTS